MKPLKEEYFAYVEGYINLVPEDHIMDALRTGKKESLKVFESLDNNTWNYAYAPGKWTLKELFLHCMDTERIFAYRALSYSRGEEQKLPPFDENRYAAMSEAERRTPASLLQEFADLRSSTFSLFSSFSDVQLSRKGVVPAGSVSVRALGFAICGHYLHHQEVMRQRYLK